MSCHVMSIDKILIDLVFSIRLPACSYISTSTLKMIEKLKSSTCNFSLNESFWRAFEKLSTWRWIIWIIIKQSVSWWISHQDCLNMFMMRIKINQYIFTNYAIFIFVNPPLSITDWIRMDRRKRSKSAILHSVSFLSIQVFTRRT